MLMPSVLNYHSHESAKQQQQISAALGSPSTPAADLVGDLAARVIARAAMPVKLAEVGATGDALKEFAKDVFEAHSETLNNISPKPFGNSDDLLGLLLLEKAELATSGGSPLVIAGGNYSFTANDERHGNGLHLDYSTACQRIAEAGFVETYLVPFRAADWPDETVQPDTGLTKGGLPFGSTAFTPELLEQVRESAKGAGLRLRVMLVPSSGIDTIDPVARYKLVIDQAVALGITHLIGKSKSSSKQTTQPMNGQAASSTAASVCCCCWLIHCRVCLLLHAMVLVLVVLLVLLVRAGAAAVAACWLAADFGLHGDDSFDDYCAMMRSVAPYAQEQGVEISMKLHSDGDAEKILDNLVAIYDAIDHPVNN